MEIGITTHWFPCVENSMPEDVLEIQNFNGTEITEEVIIPHLWGNGFGGGGFYPACRMREKGHKNWHWYNCTTAKPLYWLPIPQLPITTDKEKEEMFGIKFITDANEIKAGYERYRMERESAGFVVEKWDDLSEGTKAFMLRHCKTNK